MSLHYIWYPMDQPPLPEIAVGPYQWELSLTHLAGTVFDPSVTFVYFTSAQLGKDSQQMYPWLNETTVLLTVLANSSRKSLAGTLIITDSLILDP